jgi:DNA helicase-2/ATP-dependent DNA helicase PcrA
MMSMNTNSLDLSKLNAAQKLAVETIDGPVMVVAGPGTGKTQVLSLRIANILIQTDTDADGILCLTFTNSGVTAMRDRLRTIIGGAAGKVRVATFHGFGNELVQENYALLGFEMRPQLLDDDSAIGLCDQILHERSWKYLRPRANPAMYFHDIKALISLLKRENLSPTDFETTIIADLERIKNDPDSISSRGATKGELKADVKKKIEGLERTLEVVDFYRRYDEIKLEKCFIDYDDVLSLLLQLVSEADEVAANIREKYLYVLVDEHQDSSGVQNEFLKVLWGDEERPNIFVVGDDRQLIYGFGGASLSYFESFQHTFPGTKLITLTDNYRSTQRIVDTASTLLQSMMVKDSITGHRTGDHAMRLAECQYPRDEIILCALDIKQRIESGIDPNECALLVPKNAQVRSAMRVLADMGITVAMGDSLRLFELPETESLLRVLSIVHDPMRADTVVASLFDKQSGVTPMDAHRWISLHDVRKVTLDTLMDVPPSTGLFDNGNSVSIWGHKLQQWVTQSGGADAYTFIQLLGKELLLDTAQNSEELSRRVEVVRTLLNHVSGLIERKGHITLAEVLAYFQRLQDYGHDVPLNVFSADRGVRVMTMHASKGLEFQYVWIAHVNEKTLMNNRATPFTLPESISDRIEKKDEAVVRRQLYVAITRAKELCTLSYSLQTPTGSSQELAHIVADIAGSFDKITATETEKTIIDSGITQYVISNKPVSESLDISGIASLVAENFFKTKVSVTLLNNFFECPWKWYFRSLLQLPEPIGPSLKFGSAVHESIEDLLKSKSSPISDFARIEACLKRERSAAERELSSADSEETDIGGDQRSCIAHIVEKNIHKQSRGDEVFVTAHLDDAISIVTRWAHNRLDQIAPQYESERAYSFHPEQYPKLLITGKIDLIENLDAQNVRVTDFKTGSEKTSSEIEKEAADGRMNNYMRQLAMYSYLINHASRGNTSVAESRLEFLEAKNQKNALHTTTITSSHVDSLLVDIAEYHDSISEGGWATRECHYKSFGSNDTCPYCALSQRIFVGNK